jgi:hypothetical protein
MSDDQAALRVRLVSVTIQLEVVADDGSTLHPIETQPVRIPAAAWPNWSILDAVDQLQEQVDHA